MTKLNVVPLTHRRISRWREVRALQWTMKLNVYNHIASKRLAQDNTCLRAVISILYRYNMSIENSSALVHSIITFTFGYKIR